MTTAQYLEVIERSGYTPAQATTMRAHVEGGSAEARFVLYGRALRLGMIKREGRPLSEGKIVQCPCGGAFNDASAAAVRAHAGH